MKKRIRFFLLVSSILVLELAIFITAYAQGDESPPQACGDGITQSPNDDGAFEYCDDGTGTGANPIPADTDRCTAECGAKLMGWAWTDNGGWISLNDDNCRPEFLDDAVPADICQPQTVNYFVQVDAQHRLRGFGWSDTLGWICFGQQCSADSGDEFDVCQFSTNPSCDATRFGTAEPADGWQAAVRPDGTEDPSITGWAKILALGNAGAISLNCENESPACEFQYDVEFVKGDFGGQVWPTLNFLSWNNSSIGGAGTIWNNSPIFTIPPWLQTRFGDIYARRGAVADEASPSFNATYRILSGGGVGSIQGFQSSQGSDLAWVDPLFGSIDFPTPSTRFSNVLGKLDVDAMLCTFVGSATTCVNRFGDTVEKVASVVGIDTMLGGKVYYYRSADHDGDPLTIASDLTFLNGDNFENGSGTIIVDGDLEINADVLYDDTNGLERFRNLASVAWIVRGDVRITETIDDLAGNFVVLGNGIACDGDLLDEVSGCGQVYTCSNPTGDCRRRLTVSGLIIARKFYFNRQFPIGDAEALTRGSEIIIYDGRLLANTPPGTEDFAQALPIWRPGTFSAQ